MKISGRAMIYGDGDGGSYFQQHRILADDQETPMVLTIARGRDVAQTKLIVCMRCDAELDFEATTEDQRRAWVEAHAHLEEAANHD